MILGLILVGVMLFSVLGYAFRGGNNEEENINKLEYNGFEFVEQNGFWFTNIENFQLAFKYNPTQVGEIDAELKDFNNYYGKPLYISSENSEAELEIYRNLFYRNKLVQRVQPACLEECDENLPVKTCENNFIIIKENNNSEIIQEENCVFIQGKEENLTQITDEFLFKIFGIR